MKLSISTLGCKLNQAESDEIKNELKQKGHIFVSSSSPADVAIVRACAVTSGASQTTRELIRRAKRQGSFVIAAGCLENRDLSEIDYTAQTAGEILSKVSELANNFSAAPRETGEEQPDRTRAMIKIQNGCNFSCAYCAIPSYRGKSVSESPANIIAKIIKAENGGVKEVTLTGVNIGQYKYNRLGLAGLLKIILRKTKIERVRLGSLDPRLITSDIISLFKNPRLMPHWHLSLQSGSDSVLKRMNRGYTVGQYISIVKKLRRLYPLFSFTTDIIVGFPGETESEFKETLSFVKKIGFSKIHVFPYSKRPNTPASEAADQVQDKIRKERAKKLIALSEKVGRKFRHKLKGKTRPVLFESRKNGFWLGYTPEYIQIKYKSAKNLKNIIVAAKINPA